MKNCVILHDHLPMNGIWLYLHTPTHTSIYLGLLSSHIQYFVWGVNRTTTLQQACSVILLKRYTSVAFTCFCLPSFEDRNENQLCKDFCPIRNKWTNCLHNYSSIHYEPMHTQSLCLGFTSFNILPACLLSKTSLKTV